MGHTFQVITRTLPFTRAASTSGKLIHGLTRKALLPCCCSGAGWGFTLACCLSFFCSLRSFRFSDTASRSGVGSRVSSSITSDSLDLQIRGRADTRGAKSRASENRIEMGADLVFGCLHPGPGPAFLFRLPSPTPTSTYGDIGQGLPGFRNDAPTEAHSKFFSLPPPLGTPGGPKRLTHA